ncbi:MAG: TetR/AcrR family transcriptional regulator [Desulfobacterales bacterium]|jgi:AcrR family transcriptional regulator|nr:TetR/AcrR family transcriptional regulator [Desulfobacterales bacterium]
MQRVHRTTAIPTQVKDPELVDRRRRQIADAAVKLFVEKGFHKTTTRQIARAADISIGSLYEYFTCKEDILYLVCDFIHSEMERGVSTAMARAAGGRDALAMVIREYFMVCHRMSDFILMIYQETQSLPRQWRQRVLENELRITGLLIGVLARLSQSGELPHLDERSVELTAHNIVVLGHMWTFRRWFLGRHYSIDAYIELQTSAILRMCTGGQVPDA